MMVEGTILTRYMAGVDEPVADLEVGDRVTVVNELNPEWDGTVVEIFEHGPGVQRVRVYWRKPLGRVLEHFPAGLRLVAAVEHQYGAARGGGTDGQG